MIYQCPRCASKFQSDIAGEVICPSCNERVRIEAAPSQGTQWDTAGPGMWVSAFWETLKRSFLDPAMFFVRVGAGAGWQRPLVYAVVISVFVFSVATAYKAGFQSLAVGMGFIGRASTMGMPFLAFSIPASIIFILVGVPILTGVFVFIQAGLFHLSLMIVGAARRDFIATFRVVCYAAGPQVFQIVPLFGGIVAWIWQTILCIIGLKVVHDAGYGKSALAVFMPTIVCCGAIAMLAFALAGSILAVIASGAGR